MIQIYLIKQEIKDWYDGYTFGETSEIYCPWDVLNYIKAVLTNKNIAPEPYWINTSSNEIIKDVIENKNLLVDDKQNKIAKLCQGMPIEANIEEYFTYENLYNSDDAIWNLLYFTGYLTAHKGEKQQEQNNNEGSRALLSIPNKEIQYIFKRKVEEWFLKSMRSSDRSKLFTAFWECDEQVFSELVSEILLQSISYYDSQAEFCHGFVAGLFIGSGYNLQSNKEYGNGRPDIVVFDERHKRIGIIEVKFTKDRHTFANLAHISLDQILCRKYAEAFSPQKDICLVHWGLAFYQKQCRAVGKKVEFCTADSDR